MYPQYTSSMMHNNSSVDLNNINLTSLAVDGDLEEDQLLEYLTGYEPEPQLYHYSSGATGGLVQAQVQHHQHHHHHHHNQQQQPQQQHAGDSYNQPQYDDFR